MMLRVSRIWIVVVSLILLIGGMSILASTRLIAAHATTTPAPDTLPWCSDAFLRQASDPNAPPTPAPNTEDTRAVCQLPVTVYALPPDQRPIGGSMPAPIVASPEPTPPTVAPDRLDEAASDDDALPWCPESMVQASNDRQALPTPPPNLDDTHAVCQVKNTIHPITPPPSLNGSPPQ